MKNVSDLHAVMDRVLDGLESGILPVNEANARTGAVKVKKGLIDLQFKAIKLAISMGYKIDYKKPIDLLLAEPTKNGINKKKS